MTLLCVSSPGGGGECSVELAGDVALEASADFVVGFAFGAAFGDVGVGAGAAAPAGECDVVQGAVEGAVAAAVEPVPDGAAAAGGQRAGPGEGGVGGLGVAAAGWDQDTMAWAADTGPILWGAVCPERGGGAWGR
jgi:hypothetical protein